MPMRQTEFVKGAVSLQFQAMPFYYEHKMLVIAQTSHVVSPITEVTHRDFEYVSPEPMAVMEGISSLTPNGTDGPRLRRIAIRLGRYWDCLPWAAKSRWETENPGSVSTPDKRRYSALPDKDVVYQVIVRQPSGTVEVLAEYRFNPMSSSATNRENWKEPTKESPSVSCRMGRPIRNCSASTWRPC